MWRPSLGPEHVLGTTVALAIGAAVFLGLLEAAWTGPGRGVPTNTWMGVLAILGIMVLLIGGIALVTRTLPHLWLIPGLAILEEAVHGFVGYPGWAPTWDTIFNHWSTGYVGFPLMPWLTFPLATVMVGILVVQRSREVQAVPFLTRHPGVRTLLPFLFALAWIALWTVFDIIIVEKIFRPSEAWDYIRWYHIATWGILFPITTSVAFRRSLTTFFALIMWTGGWIDILYFWFQGRAVPEAIDWLYLTPSDAMLYARAVIALAIVALLVVRQRARTWRSLSLAKIYAEAFDAIQERSARRQ